MGMDLYNMTAEMVLRLISPDDNSELAQAVRKDLLDGGSCTLGIDLWNGRVAAVTTQPKNASLSPFFVECETYSCERYGSVDRYIKIRRKPATPPPPKFVL